MPAAAKPAFLRGREYVINEAGDTGYYDGKGGWMTPEAYRAQHQEDSASIADGIDVMRRVARAKKMIADNNTGFWGGIEAGNGGLWKGIPGTPGKILDRELQPLRSNQFLKGMKIVRQSSPSGGAGGSVSDADAVRFESVDGALYPDMTKEQLRDTLDQVGRATARRTPGISPENPIDLAETAPDDIPDGAFFRHNGKVYQQRKGAGWPGAQQPAAGGAAAGMQVTLPGGVVATVRPR